MTENSLGPLSIKVSSVDNATVVAPQGEIDLGGSPALRQALRAHITPGARVVVDLAGVPYMDSSGLATIVEGLQGARRQNAQLVLCNLTPRVKSIIEIGRLEQVFKIVATLEEALGV